MLNFYRTATIETATFDIAQAGVLFYMRASADTKIAVEPFSNTILSFGMLLFS